jgi:hypothetical protein
MIEAAGEPFHRKEGFSGDPARARVARNPLESSAMASAWTENGPVSLPPRSLAYSAGVLLLVLVFVGLGLGLKAAWRDSGAPGLAGAGAASANDADTLVAKPIVELPAAAAAPDTAKNADDGDGESANEASADALAEKTAAAQAVQSKTSKTQGDIDEILASPTERPAAAQKPAADEAPPSAPVKSDVPF